MGTPSPARIHLEGYKSIERADLELRNLNILIGANGAGKSNLISLFTLISHIVDGRLQRYVATHGGPDAFLHFGSKRTQELRIGLDFHPNSYAVSLLFARDRLIIGQEDAYFQGAGHDRPYQQNIAVTEMESKLAEHSNTHRIARHVFDAMRRWRVYHFHDTTDAAPVKQPVSLEDNVELRADASNLAAFLFFLQQRHPDSYERIVKTIRLAAPFFKDFALRPSRLAPDKIALEWVEHASDAYMNAFSLSDGTLRFMCLATLLLQPELSTTIIIDEPELGLHPYALVLLAQMLSGAAEKTTVIVSTQSVPLVNQFAPEDLIVVERNEGPSVFRRLPAEGMSEWLDDYGLGDLWEKNLLGGRPHR